MEQRNRVRRRVRGRCKRIGADLLLKKEGKVRKTRRERNGEEEAYLVSSLASSIQSTVVDSGIRKSRTCRIRSCDRLFATSRGNGCE